ncbi:hypothetical protein [Serratia aquatilis]|uniref:Uncharacterized protein n=1 Tax=Serratia aquatilis TaxID=1737515 RepID=A0ABV6EA50_9GAMM
MKPTSLKSGMRVLIKPANGGSVTNHGVFIRRVPRQPGRPAHSIIRVDEFAGLDGPQDLGDTPYSDYDVSRRVSLLEGKTK